MIYLYSRGRSQRGPSFCIPYEFLLYSGCRPLVEQSLISTLSSSPYGDQGYSKTSDESYLYLHAPQHLNREESFAYHVITRNFFAWLMGVPIVGRDPVSALLALKDRMDLWRDEGSDNLKAICDYIHQQGYGDASQLHAQLTSPSPSLHRIRNSRYEAPPTLTSPITNRPNSILAARQSLRRSMHLSEKFHRHVHIAELGRLQKKKLPSLRIPLGEGELATIGYADTSPGTAPATAASQAKPKPKRSQSIARNSVYTEILMPEYGNRLDTQPPMPTSTSTSSRSSRSISTTSSSAAYTRRPSQQSSSPPSSPSSDSDSLSTTSSTTSRVPSLTSTYSADEADAEAESPCLTTPKLATNPFHDQHHQHHRSTSTNIITTNKHNTNMLDGADAAAASQSRVRILAGDSTLVSSDTDLLAGSVDPTIEAMLGELGVVGLGVRR